MPPPGPSPPDNSNRSLNFIPGVVYDRPGLFKKFGDVITDVKDTIVHRGSSVSAVFVGANPRNNLRLEKTYAAVEKFVETEGLTKQQWEPVRDDSDWHLIFRWHRTSELLATSEVTVTWETEEWAEPGTYRLRYFGDAKSLSGSLTEFEGVSAEFQLS
jgi:neutral ceramidase